VYNTDTGRLREADVIEDYSDELGELL